MTPPGRGDVVGASGRAAAYVTTSWDDGGVHDIRLAHALRSRGLTGTFYWTVDSERFPLPSASDRAEIASLGIEVGSHTMTHPDLRAVDDDSLRWELVESKRRLEDLTGLPVPSFCYPFGYFDDRACSAVGSAGYELGRTTMGFRTDLGQDRYRLPTTIQAYPHGRRVHVTHSLKEGNVKGLAMWLSAYRARSDLIALTRTALDRICTSGGVLHLWGHSWEVDAFDLWDTLDAVFTVVSERDDVVHVSNGELPIG
jgi:peptidoglycan/xylan/chitin deacetylase (PgdA/CDA1 family)